MAVLYGHILNPPSNELHSVFPVTARTGRSDAGQEGDLSIGLDAARQIKRQFLWDTSHLLRCSSSGGSDDISCRRKKNTLFTSIYNRRRWVNAQFYAIERRQNQSCSFPLDKSPSTKWAEVPHCETDDHWSTQLIDPGGRQGWIQRMKETQGLPVRLDGRRKASFFPRFPHECIALHDPAICICYQL